MNERANKLDWNQVESVMGRALELPEEEQAAYLERQPPSIRAEVESLLEALRNAANLFGQETGTHASTRPVSGSMTVDAGMQLGPYRIDAVIGQGGMGVVYRALDTRLNRVVAVKLLFDVADPAARRRFQREAQTASSLNHPHILTVHDVGELEGRQYLVTEFVDGGTLKDWARADKPGWRQILELLVGVADGWRVRTRLAYCTVISSPITSWSGGTVMPSWRILVWRSSRSVPRLRLSTKPSAPRARGPE
jgi:hypothetical protein